MNALARFSRSSPRPRAEREPVRRVVAFSLVLGVTLASARAHATDIAACLTASEKGQRARTAGKLREARGQFLVCGSDGCPAIVRRDCAQWQVELISLMPSVVFGAKDKRGRDLFDVIVTMDGEALLTKLDGKAVAVDPGPHTFKFEMPGQTPVVERALVKEGEKTRVVAVTFGPEIPDGGAADPSKNSAPNDEHAKPAEDRGHTALPWVVVGIGAATVVTGLVIVLTAPKLPTGCNDTTLTCVRTPGVSDENFARAQDQAGRADSQPRLGLIVGGVGLAVAAGGLLWHFLEPTGPRRSALRVSPWASPGSSGFVFDGAF